MFNALSQAIGLSSISLAVMGMLSASALLDEGCETPTQPPVGFCEGDEGAAFLPGPYGSDIWQTAADFTIPTDDGDWNFEESWTGCDSYIFLTYHRDWDYATSRWNDGLRELLNTTPENVHFIVLSYDEGENVAEDIAYLEGQLDQALGSMSAEDQAYWYDRWHFANVGAVELDNWVGDRFAEYGNFGLAIDRLQRVREIGMMNELSTLGLFKAALYVVGYEPEYFNFEWDRKNKLDGAEGVTVIPVFEQVEVSDPNWAGQATFGEIAFPDAETMAGFDTMEFDLGTYCPDNLQENCPDWDYEVNLYLCDQDNPDDCSETFGRWITTYKREGRWVTDVSDLLALVKDGGNRRVRFYSQQRYFLDLSVRLSNQDKGMSPSEAVYLYSGGSFNEDYNDRYEPMEIDIPADVTKVQIYALITGHGFGADVANCAEFCNHEHHFVVNSNEHVRRHPTAGTAEGCVDEIDIGTVPNQYGTWPYGRSGWCPGLDVKPWMKDITADIIPGQSNTIDYYATMDGEEYVPEPNGSGNNLNANIHMQSWLVYWR